ncbi:uncharacterized protein LOC112089125 [Eutrema salsugineum]|uniref:uncharacterized protein LOC112089125 n=1 Tax=Eutrema salsugineum TaxID=72664 RepID=UPI000CECE9DB|nr:uncharacterized protein LOC112089125 [Eutrema salsugineum]
MPGISIDVTCHELNVDPTFKPVKQKRRNLGPERAKAVNDEVERLLKIGSIAEAKYPDWLTNPVVVKKKNGKWRVCVDFTDLNKACPKDSFPLPHIDRLVEATAGNRLLTFMDAFSGYNQILMHPDDREKTAFMPFGLKNAGATYQRLVNKMFAAQLGKPWKFAVTSGEFLGYLVTHRGIEANPKQIKALIEMPSPRTKREVQRLTGRVAALNRFISRSTDKCLPFYDTLRGNKKFEWEERCETAFQELKNYLASPPILAKPVEGEPLFLYIAVSATAVSGVLIREERSEQKFIFYFSQTLTDAETRYPQIEKVAPAVVVSARKLRPYFQSHSIIVLATLPLRSILHSPSQSGRLAKSSAKSQVLADFLIELPAKTTNEPTLDEVWTLHVDGWSSKHGLGIGIRLTSPTGEILEQSFRLNFHASNNKAEYEALIAGIRLAQGIGVRKIRTFCDSQLVACQVNGEYEAKDGRMGAYLKVVRDLVQKFDKFELTRIPRGENTSADALAALASTSDPDLRRTIPVEFIERPSIEEVEGVRLINPPEQELEDDEAIPMDEDASPAEPEYGCDKEWLGAIRVYIADGERLDAKKGRWADELEGVLWSHRTTPRRATGETPFALVYGSECIIPPEVDFPGIRRRVLPGQEGLNHLMMLDELDLINKKRDQALIRIQNYQQATARYYNKNVRSRRFKEGELVLPKVFQNTAEKNAGKLGANWEGPYKVTKVVRPGVYKLATLADKAIPRSWNAMHLKMYYH